MNRFRENRIQGASIKAKWLLAAAYQLAGQSDAAKSAVEGLVADPNITTKKHSETFSSHLSDLGLQLNALSTLGKNQDAEIFIQAIANELNKKSHNTHGISWALMAVSHHVLGIKTEKLIAEYSQDKSSFNELKSKKAYFSKDLGHINNNKLNLQLKNTSGNKLYANIISKGIPFAGDEIDGSSGLDLNIEYRHAGNKEIVDITSSISQGQDIQIQISVRNTTGQLIENIALSHLIPTGWEIHNANYGVNDQYDYKDVHDDRIYTYFSLKDKQIKSFTILVNPSYTGRFYLPTVSVEAMYQSSIYTRQKGGWVDVEKSTPYKIP